MEFQPQQTDETMLPDAFDPDEVDHGSMYYIMHWGAYKGHIRGIIRGLIVGCAIGAVVGLGFAGLAALGVLGGVTLGAAAGSFALSTLVAGFSAFGGLMAAGIMGRIGNASGNAAAQLAETELRLRYPELTEISLDSPEPGYGHHFKCRPIVIGANGSTHA